MQKTKKEKYQQEIKRNLKTIVNLDPELLDFIKNVPLKGQSLLSRSFPFIHGLQILRIFTLLEVNFIVSSFIDALQKTNYIKLENLKIGVIGGGIMGRLIVNTLIVFTKQGLKPENIMVSTRQPENMQFYSDNFSVRSFFDNEKIAKQADLIFVATPSTLDNWILTDLKNNISKRINQNMFETNRTSYASTITIQQLQSTNQVSKSILTDKSGSMQESIVVSKTHKKIISPSKEESICLQPFVYILTSDFTSEKCKRIFDFPVVVPWLKATDIPYILEKIQNKVQSTSEEQQSKQNEKVVVQLQKIMEEQIIEEGQKQMQTSNDYEGMSHEAISGKFNLEKIIRAFDFSFKRIQKQWNKEKKIADSKAKNEQVSNQSRSNSFSSLIFKSQQTYQSTFLTKGRKWRMAYHNFLS